MGVEIRHLRAFLAAVEERSITRAARRLHITQPALSRTLADLEQHVGAALLRRSPRGVEATAEGEAFRDRAQRALDAFEEAVRAPAGRPLRVGHAWGAFGPFTSPLLRAWRQGHPDHPLELVRRDDAMERLEAGEVDACVVRGAPPERGYAGARLHREERWAALPAGHRLAGAEALALADLAGEGLLVNTVTGTTGPGMWGEGPRPRVVGDTANVDEWIDLIAAGAGIGVTLGSVAMTRRHAEVVYVPLEDAPAVQVHLVWRRDAAHPALPGFVETARRITGADRH
ncbi:LysR family transcriptional regulator [Nocardiopsis sp. RSe5-2]|uniref:LysR family transcriptional regulator n=1 Tax=Nocardiopsis endophytica TaxID=3018445 RepID=A0ABT4U987_9ACTN|nr:LysR family transcriptional regulator [Nocardiopsis endophytica]MDA2813511.1 LysR family transcriptional regulator [Nocardiopsis endophytica]